MKTISYTGAPTELPVNIEAEVIVIGAGPGGLGAAVAAARSGADTVLIERYSAPGGMAFSGEVSPFMCNHVNDKSLDRGVYLEWVERIQSYLPGEIADGEAFSARNRMIPKDIAALAAEDLLRDAGVRLVYHHHLFDCIKKANAIEAAVLFSKSGLSATQGAIFIDCSGDADLAAKAGCQIEYGNAEGFCQPMTLCFKLANVNFDDSNPDNLTNLRKQLTEVYIAAKESGEVDCPRENILMFTTHDPTVMHFNTTRVIKHSAINGLELSEAEIIARDQIRSLIKLFQAKVPAMKNARLHSMASHIGVRESRRVIGENYIGLEAFERRAKYPDAIAKVRYPVDIHNPSGTGTDLRHLPPGEWYEIPYGCIVAKGVDNLLIGGRPISVDHGLHSSMRVMPPACSVGQAAGIAAAMALTAKKLPRELDGVEVRKQLIKFGADLT
ncbi:MAG: FAD-dependent oxidoreductase [Victivallaceae bacterium]